MGEKKERRRMKNCRARKIIFKTESERWKGEKRGTKREREQEDLLARSSIMLSSPD